MTDTDPIPESTASKYAAFRASIEPELAAKRKPDVMAYYRPKLERSTTSEAERKRKWRKKQ